MSRSLHRVAFHTQSTGVLHLRARRARLGSHRSRFIALPTHASSPVYTLSFGSENHSIRPPAHTAVNFCMFVSVSVLFLGCEVGVN